MSKKIAYIGCFGHWICVANEFSEAKVKNVGAAPAYVGEDISELREYPSLPDKIPYFDSPESLFQKASPDVAVISTRPDHIATTAIKAADAGCDIICEKPLGLTKTEIESLRKAVLANGVRLLPMLSMRADTVFIKARELFRAGVIGEVILINVRKSYQYGTRPEWFGERAKYGGTFLWVGIHAVDMIHFITGLDFVSVTARHANFAHPERTDCEDGCTALFELSNRAFATVSLDYLRPMSASTHGDDWIRIAGTKGVMEASSNEKTLTLINDRGETKIKAPADPAPFYLEILKDSNAGFSFIEPEDGFRLTEVSLGARESADRNSTIIKFK